MNHFSLRSKLIVGAGLALSLSLLAVVLTGWLSMQKSGEEAMSHSSAALDNRVDQNLMDASQLIAAEMAQLMDRGFDLSRVLSRIASSTALGNSDGRLPFERGALMRVAGDILASSPHVGSAYMHFEPNGYDASDTLFLGGNLTHSSDTGGLEIYWVREGEQLAFYRTEDSDFKMDTTLNDKGLRESEWYLCSRDQLRPCLMDPYLYEISEGYEVLLTSLVYPIITANNFRGVAGVDLNLPDIQKKLLSIQQSFYGGAAEIHLLSDRNTLVASSRLASSLGQSLKQVDADLAQAIERAEAGAIIRSAQQVMLVMPIKFDDVGNVWRVVIRLPSSVAYQATAELQNLLDTGQQQTTSTMLLTGFFLLVLSVLSAAVWLRITLRPMQDMQQRFADLGSAEGDLTHQLQVEHHAELIHMADGFNRFAAKLRDMILSLKQASQELSKQTDVMAGTATQVSAATADQQTEMQGVASAMHQMSSTAHEVARLAAETAKEAEESNSSLQQVRDVLSHTVAEVKAVGEGMMQIRDSISEVAQSSENITGITQVIQGIAEQTNLLALNAAIEAARAGEHGRGFAVVADEVRTLAARTQSSTAEINALIDALQTQVSHAVQGIKASSERTLGLVSGADQAWQQMEQLASRMTGITDNVIQVAAAAEEQNQVNDEMNRNINGIENATEVLAALGGDVKQVSEAMHQVVDQLSAELQGFKV
jgi:methyl-accepting chemotaxis protein